MGLVAHDVLPPRRVTSLDSETRGVDILTSVLMPSLLSGLVGNIRGLEQPEIPTQPAPFGVGGSIGGHAGIPLKSEAPGPSCEVDLIPPMSASKEVSKCKPANQEMSQHDSPVFNVNPEDVPEVIVDDDDDLNLMLDEPQAVSMPVMEPAPHRK